MTLPTALAAFNQFRQFIIYVATPSKTRAGKTDKHPCSYLTGRYHDAMDPSIWLDHDSAVAHAQVWTMTTGQAYDVGFVITAETGIWFLDIDNCLVNGAWSEHAVNCINWLAGCAVEVSRSGTGLHLFGKGRIPPHACRGLEGMELYHADRFVALGHASTASGTIDIDCSDGLARVIARYFPGSGAAVTPAQWTDAPTAEWRGSVDDDELIRRACQSRSAAGAFGARASFVELWDADVAALSRAYPAEGRQYDESSADAALAQHLAFWTGKDCARIRRLMLRSKLARDKWEREDYLPRTIVNAVSMQREVCADKPAGLAATSGGGVSDVEGETFASPDHQKQLFDGMTYVLANHSILVPGGQMIAEGRFNAMYGGFVFSLDRGNTKTTRSAFEAFTQSQAVRFPKVHATQFRPELTVGSVWDDGGQRLVNSYWPGPAPKRVEGNIRPFMDHMRKLFPIASDLDIVINYMAAIVQHPGHKFKWTILVQGVQGNGKSLLSECVAEAVGRQFVFKPKAKEITAKFNDWQESRIFIQVEDIYVEEHRADVINELKVMITEEYLELEGKGSTRATRRICCNYILNSNFKDAVQKTINDRRFGVFYTPQQHVNDLARDGMGGDYFPKLYTWLKSGGYQIVAQMLRTHKIPAEMNPALGAGGTCHRAPDTSSTSAAISESAGRLEQEIQHAIEGDTVGFRGGWISMHYVDLLIRDLRLDDRYPRNKRRAVLQGMGYDYHPNLLRGQVNNAVAPDGCKPVLFLTTTHPDRILSGSGAANAYSAAQLDNSALRLVK